MTLARDKRVIGMARSGSELHLEVRVPGRPTPFEVILDPEHEEWECDCPSKEASCSHVVAATLAVEQAGGDLPQSERAGAALRYLLEPATGGIAVSRVLVRGESSEPLGKPLLALIAEGKGGTVATIEADLVADRLLAVRAGPVSGERLDRLLEVLAGARDVRWKGDPVTTSAEPVMPRAIVEDITIGVRVKIQADPLVREVVAVGCVRTHDNALRPIGAIDLSGTRLDKLPQTFDVPRSAFPELIGTTLPALAKRIDVEVRAQSLPQLGGREEPRIAFDVEQDGDTLRVFPTMVYGDPPRARVDGGRLVYLAGAIPSDASGKPSAKGPSVIMRRDEDAERRLVHRLRDELNLALGRRVELTGREAFAMQNGLAAWLRTDARAANAASAVDLEAKVMIERVGGTSSRMDMTLTTRDGRAASIGAALRAWQAGVDLVPLPGGGWGRVPMSWFDANGTRVADLLAARSDDKVVPIYALPDLARLCAELDEPPPPELDRLRPLLDGFDGIAATTPEGGFVGELRPYQQRGLDWLAFCRQAGLGCVLADDMGLGKTIQALAVLVRDRGQTLVVSPTSVLFNWLAELRLFRPDLVVATYHGARRVLDPSADVVLTSYPILRNDSDELAEPSWETVILDESQTIKNPDSQVARAAYRLKAKWRLTLSGTPIENRLDELWSQLHFTNPGLLGGRTDFQDRWADPIVQGSSSTAARLRERIRPFVLRRMKAEVAR